MLSFEKSLTLSPPLPPPHPPSLSDTMLRDQRNYGLTVSTLSVGWEEGVGRWTASRARMLI